VKREKKVPVKPDDGSGGKKSRDEVVGESSKAGIWIAKERPVVENGTFTGMDLATPKMRNASEKYPETPLKSFLFSFELDGKVDVEKGELATALRNHFQPQIAKQKKVIKA
jgi:hypothetical protein